MKNLRYQSEEYLIDFKERLLLENNPIQPIHVETVAKIDYILDCRKNGETPLLCQGVCGGDCGEECKNLIK